MNEILHAFWFPHSAYLASRWWHRLAVVLFVVWGLAAIGNAYGTLVGKPYQQCIAIRDHVSDLPYASASSDCGKYAFDYFFERLHQVPDTNGKVLAVLLWVYVLLSIPGLLYRVILYIVKGKSWRQSTAT